MCYKTLTCPLCCQTKFSNIETFKISLVKVTNRPLICPICNEILLGLDKFTIHIFGHSIVMNNTDDDEYENDKNNLTVEKNEKKLFELNRNNNKKNLTNNHNNKSDEQIFIKQEFESQNSSNSKQCKCDICDINFRSNDLLKMHENLLHNKIIIENGVLQEPKFHCHLCTKAFKMKGSLKVHLRVAHQGIFYHGSTSKKIAYSRSNSPKLLASSLLCDNLVKLKHLNQSNETITNSNCNIKTTRNTLSPPSVYDDSLSFNNATSNLKVENVQQQAGFDQIKVWECDICSKSFTTKYFLKKHKRLHTGEMPYSCAICGKTFTFQQSYHKHLLYHSDEKPHVCGTCGRAFKELSTLHNHERIHSGEKPFKCETCGKCFRQRVSYLVHRRIHTGVMPYKCTTCEKSFRYKVSQRTHKCTTQPPGLVVKQSGDLLQKLFHPSELDNNNNNNNNIESDTNNIPIEDMIKPNNEPNEEIHNQTLDDILKESCTRLGIDNNTFSTNVVSDIFDNVENYNESLNSPSEKLQNLCLYSPTENGIGFDSALETINEDCFKKLLYGD